MANPDPVRWTIPCAVCRTGTMTAFRETPRVVIYRCPECRSIHADLRPGVELQPLEDPRLTEYPPLPLNCPKCPARLQYLYTTDTGNVIVYVCAAHGPWHLGPGGLYPPRDGAHRREDPGNGRKPRPCGDD